MVWADRERPNVLIHGRNLSAKLNVFSRISDALIFRKNIFNFGIPIKSRFGFWCIWFKITHDLKLFGSELFWNVLRIEYNSLFKFLLDYK